MSDGNEMILLTDAFKIVDRELAGVRVAMETVSLTDALGRTLAADQESRLDLPPFNKSAMDGYAVLAGDQRSQYRVLETVAAGAVPTARLEAGTAIKVMTGAPVPEGAGKVIMQEQTTQSGDTLVVESHAGRDNICQAGEDVRRGDVICRESTALGPAELANLAACGLTEVPVARRLRAEIISTGDEIVDHPDKIGPGKIINANEPMLVALCQRHGLEVAGRTTVPDDRQATISALQRAMERADVLLLSGGVSVGEFDFVTEALAEIGAKLHFTRLAVKPGKPTIFATVGDRAIFGLPGNPVAVYLMFHLLVLRAANIMQGGAVGDHRFQLPLGRDFSRRKARREQYQPATITPEGTIAPAEFHGSAHLAALVGTDGFFVIPKGITDVPTGQKVAFVPIGRG